MTNYPLARGPLVAKALTRFLVSFVVVAALLLLPAGTVHYWEAWAYMAVLFTPMSLVLVYLVVADPALLERRMRMREKDAKQDRIVKLGSIFYLLACIIPGLDRRFEWSSVPTVAVIVADVFVLLGYLLFIAVLRANSYASRIIEVEKGQRVVNTGPYALVRHPMYLAILVMYLFTPIALGSWWAVIAALPLVPILGARILNEEQHLLKELEGYEAYTQTTRYRLLPGVW